VVKIPFGDGRSGAINAIKRKEPQRNVVPGLSSMKVTNTAPVRSIFLSKLRFYKL
jgi:hypothetical protein